jgi:hypothetical protein
VNALLRRRQRPKVSNVWAHANRIEDQTTRGNAPDCWEARRTAAALSRPRLRLITSHKRRLQPPNRLGGYGAAVCEFTSAHTDGSASSRCSSRVATNAGLVRAARAVISPLGVGLTHSSIVGFRRVRLEVCVQLAATRALR